MQCVPGKKINYNIVIFNYAAHIQDLKSQFPLHHSGFVLLTASQEHNLCWVVRDNSV